MQRWVVRGLRVVSVALGAWIPCLAVILQTSGSPRGVAFAWVALDFCELAALVSTLAAVRHAPRLVPAAAGAAAGLFLLDALVDTATSTASPSALASATLMAVCCELPVAAACLWLARTPERALTEAWARS